MQSKMTAFFFFVLKKKVNKSLALTKKGYIFATNYRITLY